MDLGTQKMLLGYTLLALAAQKPASVKATDITETSTNGIGDFRLLSHRGRTAAVGTCRHLAVELR